jgi:hypothetical protein
MFSWFMGAKSNNHGDSNGYDELTIAAPESNKLSSKVNSKPGEKRVCSLICQHISLEVHVILLLYVSYLCQLSRVDF